MYQNRVHLIGYLGKNPEQKSVRGAGRKYAARWGACNFSGRFQICLRSIRGWTGHPIRVAFFVLYNEMPHRDEEPYPRRGLCSEAVMELHGAVLDLAVWP